MRLRTHSELEAENERLKLVIADAHQNVGQLLDMLGIYGTQPAIDLLDYLSTEGVKGRSPLNNEFIEDWTK